MNNKRHSNEKAASPTCRTCYAMTLSKYDRARFYDEPVTGCVHLCDQHQERFDAMMRDLPRLPLIKAGPNPEGVTFPRVTSPGGPDA